MIRVMFKLIDFITIKTIRIGCFTEMSKMGLK